MHYILFTTQSCPKCPQVKDYVSNLKLTGDILDNTDPRFFELTEHLNVTEAPTFILFDDANKELFRANEVCEIEDWMKQQVR